MDKIDYNYYMDESCHLLNSDSKYMVIGAVACPKKMAANISYKIKEIKLKHGLSSNFEIKSTKISPAKCDFYKDVIDLFLNTDNLCYRAVVIDKEQLDHQKFGQSHDDFYYKMVYTLFRYFLLSNNNHIYLDYKDTMSYQKSQKVTECLTNNNRMPPGYAFSAQPINSKESNLMQLADLLIGLTTYNARNLTTSETKKSLIDYLESSTGVSLFHTTNNYSCDKIDILNWRAK